MEDIQKNAERGLHVRAERTGIATYHNAHRWRPRSAAGRRRLAHFSPRVVHRGSACRLICRGSPRWSVTRPRCERLKGREVVADFRRHDDLDASGSDGPGAAVERLLVFLARRIVLCTTWRRWWARGVRDRAGLRGLVDHGVAPRPCSWRGSGRSVCAQVDAGRSTRRRGRTAIAGGDAAAIEALFVDLFLDAHDCSIRRDRRPAARAPGGPVLPRLLRLLLLALYIFCGDHLGGKAEAGEHRRQRRGGRGGRADRRRSAPAGGGRDPARRLRLRP